ncbi:MAG: ABC transporter permease [Candidatus Nanoarchaeia archaeon]
MIQDYFILAVRNLRKRKLRTWLTMLGIFISIATIFMLISLSLGLQGAVEEQFRLLGTDKFFILPAIGFLGPPGSVGGVILTENDVNVVRKVQGVKDYSYFVAANAKLEFNSEIKYLFVWGVPLETLEVFTEGGAWKAEEGQDLKPGDSGTIMIGSLYKTRQVFKKPVRVGDRIDINDEKFRVKSIAFPIGNPGDDSSILMSMDDLRRVFEIPERVDQIMVQVDQGEDITEVAERVEKKLRNSRDLTEDTQDFEISTPEELLESFSVILNIITAFLGGVAAISLIVGGIGIANTMYTSVLERTNEIGTMKAVGARNSDIMYIFLIESGLLGLIGGIVGVLLGYGISKSIEYIAVTQLNTGLLQAAAPWYLVLGCLAFGFLIGAISGTLPAIQASKTNVVDALRYE